jgi:pimeloyl-ACP methyl ester carboxylesterase
MVEQRGAETHGRLNRKGGHEIAWKRRAGSKPTVLWLGGFRSDMGGTKAEALDQAAETRGWEYLRFDYFAHGASTGEWKDATIGRWREDALAVIDHLSDGPLVLVGSSMGGWLACLSALARPERVKAMVLIAPAADFTELLMKPRLSAEALATIERKGEWIETGGYESSFAITREFLDEAREWQILGAPIAIHTPVRILQGQRDPDVPWEHALKLADRIATDDVVFTLIKDGDHRLSTPQNLNRITDAVGRAVGLAT